MTLPVVIVGSGLAGYTVAREFRKLDAATPLVVVSRDDAFFLPLMQQARALAATLAGTPTAVAYPAMPEVVAQPVATTCAGRTHDSLWIKLGLAA